MRGEKKLYLKKFLRERERERERRRRRRRIFGKFVPEFPRGGGEIFIGGNEGQLAHTSVCTSCSTSCNANCHSSFFQKLLYSSFLLFRFYIDINIDIIPRYKKVLISLEDLVQARLDF